jgi:N-acyl-D-aspartate/D-glutamate deacylase
MDGELGLSGRLLLKGGVVVDGSGAPRVEADVRVRDGVIAEIGPSLSPQPDERVFDARDCLVTPGFIDHHTHYDGTAFWASDLDPSAGYGVTSIIMGNCGFGVAPLAAPAAYSDAVDIMSFIEDLPRELFDKMPWDWTKWSGYRDALLRQPLPVNFGVFFGHLALRISVMGPQDAWTRAATPDEIGQMAAALDEGLSAGAMGFSTNLFDVDRHGRPVPSRVAADEEFHALFAVVARHRGATAQVAVDAFIRLDADEAIQRVAAITRDIPVRVQWVPFPTLAFQREVGLQSRVADVHRALAGAGRDVWAGVLHYPLSFTLALSPNKESAYVLAGQRVWLEAAAAPSDEEKRRLLGDADWRARARAEWDRCTYKLSVFGSPGPSVLDNSENGAGPVDVTLGEYAAGLGLHPSDALAEWFLRNGVNSSVLAPPLPVDEDLVVELLRDPRTVGAVSDAGAHLQTICTAGVNMELITKFARDEKRLSIEEAVHVQTGKIADFYGLADRGRLVVGLRADIAVFNLAEVECRPKRKVWDVPSGRRETAWRWTRDPAPMRLTLVNGAPTFEDGRQTPARPGAMISPRGTISAEVAAAS